MNPVGLLGAAAMIAIVASGYRSGDAQRRAVEEALRAQNKVGWWWSSDDRKWRAVAIKDPSTGHIEWRGPYLLDRSRAESLYFTEAERNWGKEVTIYTHENGNWRYGV